MSCFKTYLTIIPSMLLENIEPLIEWYGKYSLIFFVSNHVPGTSSKSIQKLLFVAGQCFFGALQNNWLVKSHNPNTFTGDMLNPFMRPDFESKKLSHVLSNNRTPKGIALCSIPTVHWGRSTQQKSPKSVASAFTNCSCLRPYVASIDGVWISSVAMRVWGRHVLKPKKKTKNVWYWLGHPLWSPDLRRLSS